MSVSVGFTVFGSLASMKNRRIPLKSNPYKTIPNAQARAFRSDFLAQVPRSAMRCLGSLTRPLSVRVTVYYRDMRSDLDAALVYDCLQEAGVVQNDRYIRHKIEIARIDKANPRVEVEIWEQ